MDRLIIRHQVEDYEKWKPVFDEHESARREAGLRTLELLRNADNPAEILIEFAVSDDEKARQFVDSEDLRQKMKKAGVAEEPEIFFGSKS